MGPALPIGAYAASKHAVLGLTRCFAVELASQPADRTRAHRAGELVVLGERQQAWPYSSAIGQHGRQNGLATGAAMKADKSGYLRDAVDRCEDTRMSLELNVAEDLALSALSVRLEEIVGSAD